MNNGEIIIEQLSVTFASKNLRYMTQRLEIIVTMLENIEDMPLGTVILGTQSLITFP